jgi:hypothetical protein
MICANCHGPYADSRGRQAENLLIMTGGEARVANLKSGLFGPGNRQRVFASEEAAARYMGWMALGGTQRTIPQSILAIVGNSDVLGVPRPLAPPRDANMLSTAKDLCGAVLAPSTPTNTLRFFPELGGYDRLKPLVWSNGDRELWTRLCTLDNRPPLRAIYVDWDAEKVDMRVRASYDLRSSFDLYPSDAYPSTAPVGNDKGQIETGIQPDNLFPWCLRTPSSAAQLSKAQAHAMTHPLGGRPLPFCPESIVPRSGASPPPGYWGGRELDAWSTRGAINAGFAVFLYLDDLMKRGGVPRPRYDQCELSSK